MTTEIGLSTIEGNSGGVRLSKSLEARLVEL